MYYLFQWHSLLSILLYIQFRQFRHWLPLLILCYIFTLVTDCLFQAPIINTFTLAVHYLSQSHALLSLLLYFQFGHGLQQLLTTVPYSELAGQNNIQWDALQTVSMFMSRLLFNPYMLSRLSYHIDTGAQLPNDIAVNICKGKDNWFFLRPFQRNYI